MTCTASTTESATSAVQTALSQAASNPGADTVEIGAGTFKTPSGSPLQYSVSSGTQPVTIRGRGASTILVANSLTGPNWVLAVNSTAAGDTISVESLNVVIPSGANQIYGVVSSGPNATTIRNVSVTAADSTVQGSIGFVVDNGDLLTNSSVALPLGGTPTNSALNIGAFVDGTSLATGPVIQDSTFSASFGVTPDLFGAASGYFGKVVRCRIDAIFGAGQLLKGGTLSVEDTFIKVEDGAAGPGLTSAGLVATPSTGSAAINARHVTIVSSPGTTPHAGITAVAGSSGSSATVDLSDSILAGLDTSINSFKANSGTASVSIKYSDFDPAKIAAPPMGFTAGTITQGAGNLNVDPQFANAAGGDYSLALGSPLIDAGTPGALDPGESPTDLLGNPRITDGNADLASIRDMGAFEHPTVNPPPPPTPDPDPTLDTTPPDTKAGKFSKKTRKKTLKLRFSSTEAGSTFTCKLDKKAARSCKSPYTAKKLKPGKHVLLVTATDAAGNADPTPAKLRFKVLKKHKRHHR